MGLGDWLRSLGLAQYEAVFRENAIDAEVLHDLTENHLREMGLPLGARLKLLKAISALASGAEPIGLTSTIVPAGPTADTAERRQVTVMFSDLVGSTALSGRMDPEDLREVIAAYHKCVADIVLRFDGFVAQYLGDGVLVYFGYPQAHEDDAELAVRAGLELVAAVVTLKTRVSLQTRIGIATGLVVVGDLLGAGSVHERGIVGETPNLAARLQGLAKPNMVIIGESTRRLLGNLFELEDLGAKELKGIVGPVRAWAALRASSVASRFEALHANTLTALVGREEEIELLLRRWARSKAGKGQVVLISGEAGIGKSRLIAALLEQLSGEPHTRLRYFCSPQHTDSPLYPVIGQLERAAGLRHEDTSATRLDKIEGLLTQTATSKEDAALITDMLSLPSDGRYPAIELPPQQRRQRTLEALITQMQALSRQNPVLMIFEDTHWSDPTSLEVFGRAVHRIPNFRVLLVVTFRPEFEPPWIGQPHVTALTINRLAEREIGAMIDRLAGDEPLSASIRQDIIERTDGIPLFVEEITKAVLEADNEAAAEHVIAAVPSRALAVPASLHASLLARLDRLGPAKEVAQIGAAIGREFSHLLLTALIDKPEPDLRGALDRLIAAGLLFRQGVPPHATYLFKHALVQDAAYGTLLRERRAALYARIADTLARQFAEIAENQPELLARHCAEAGLVEKALVYWLKAGQLAGARSANAEAVSHLTKALALLKEWADIQAREHQELEVLIALGPALIATRGYAANEVVATYERARELLRITGNRTRQDTVLTGVFVSYYNLAKFEKGLEVSRESLQWAEEIGDAVSLCIGHRMLAVSYNSLGRFAEARSHAEQALCFYDPERHSSIAWRYVHDLGVSSMCHRANALWHLGFPDQAISVEQESLAWAAKVNHHNTTGYTLFYGGALPAFRRRDIPMLDRYAEQLVAHGREHEQPQWVLWGNYLQGPVLTAAGQASEAITRIGQALQTAERMQNKAFRPMVYGILAEAKLALGDGDGAIQLIDDALSLAEQTLERWMIPELLRIKGNILLSAGIQGIAVIEECFQSSIESAKRQGSRMFELRSSISLARCWHEIRKTAQARKLIEPIYKGFTEGFYTLELKEAKTLLDELAQ